MVRVERVILNPVPDGLFYHLVKFEGKEWAHYGRFIDVARPGRLEFTWVSVATQGYETVVTMTFAPKGGETLVTLRHAGNPDDEMGRRHEEGWTWILGALAERFEAKAAATCDTPR